MDFLTFDTVVIGTGAAGYNAACEIRKLCDKTVCIITEDKYCGTSRNTGSDKQTYYKLTLSGNTPDSVRKMAEDLFSGGGVDGDNALCEAALSVSCFNNLCSLGVPFPRNRYGEYVGYKTDHDPYMRATSAGPLTSKFMTEALEKQAEKLGVPLFDKCLAVEILKTDGRVSGVLCLNKENGEYMIFRCNNAVLATGGPAGIYKNTVYPEGHTGSSALALTAGASLHNMTEWQYGLSSVNPKWNVSGTYMQVLPRFVSVDCDGNECEFLADYFSDRYEALSFVFLKGYQWPFDCRRAENGSSKIDLAVYNECVRKGRRVYLDFTKNPFGLKEIDYTSLSDEAYSYLKNADALSGTPIERLYKMNSPAIALYKSKGVDISKEYLEIALSAQHNNGGISVNMWWQTETEGLFAVGECAGTHGVARPGGSALNAGQAGSLRAAQYISQKCEEYTDEKSFTETVADALGKHNRLKISVLSDRNSVSERLSHIREKMSIAASAVRDISKIRSLSEEISEAIKSFPEDIYCDGISSLVEIYKYYDTLLVQSAVLKSIEKYYEDTPSDRGSAVYIPSKGVCSPPYDTVTEIKYLNGEFILNKRRVRPIPDDDSFFENIWRTFRENRNIY